MNKISNTVLYCSAEKYMNHLDILETYGHIWKPMGISYAEEMDSISRPTAIQDATSYNAFF